jgi:hypothetical protein
MKCEKERTMLEGCNSGIETISLVSDVEQQVQ